MTYYWLGLAWEKKFETLPEMENRPLFNKPLQKITPHVPHR